MARIRTIKPEFFTSEDIVSLSPLARLLYIALWCEADREGRFEWKPKTFKLRYLPGDSCDVDLLASELISAGLIVLYSLDGKSYAEVPSFTKHQVINNRESESQIPSRVAHASTTRQPRVQAEGRKEGKGKEGRVPSSTSDDDPIETPLAVASLPLIDKTEFEVHQQKIDEWSDSFPAVDVAQQVKAMRAWLVANPSNRKTRNGVEKFVVGWLTKAQNQAPRMANGSRAAPNWAGAI